MNDRNFSQSASMIDQTKLAAFFLWEYTGYQNTLALWYCTEDIASFFERCRIYTLENVYDVLRINRNGAEYKTFIRNIAYRIHLYTGIQDESFNWYTAEKLLGNSEWREAVVFMAGKLKELREGGMEKGYKLLSPSVKNYYGK